MEAFRRPYETRRARTTHGSPAAAERIAAALEPDNTDEMDTHVNDDAVVTTVERDTTSGLQSTVDDYVVNLRVAAQLRTTRKNPTMSERSVSKRKQQKRWYTVLAPEQFDRAEPAVHPQTNRTRCSDAPSKPRWAN
ncbi:KEOPS complex subunit Pcc1 [Halomicroarcula sp. GCM10025710]